MTVQPVVTTDCVAPCPHIQPDNASPAATPYTSLPRDGFGSSLRLSKSALCGPSTRHCSTCPKPALTARVVCTHPVPQQQRPVHIPVPDAASPLNSSMENSPPQHLNLPNSLQQTGTRDWRQLTTMVMTNSYYNDPSSHPSTSAVTLDSPTWYPPYNYWATCPLAPSNTPQGPLFPPTKVTLVPAPVSYAYLASACSTLPYPITASHLHNATLSGLPHGQPKPLPRPGAPARPSAQRLHAARMQPFPTRHQLSDVRTQLHPHALAQVRPPTMSHVSWQVAADHSSLAVPGTHAQMPLYVRPGYRITRPAPCAAPRFDQLHHAGLTFTVIYRLGEGSAGRVVLGEHAGRLYAIKAIHPRRAARTHTHRDYFLREREVMIRIGHSASNSNGARTFLVPLLMSWEEEGAVGRIFFVMVRAVSSVSFWLFAGCCWDVGR